MLAGLVGERRAVEEAGGEIPAPTTMDEERGYGAGKRGHHCS